MTMMLVYASTIPRRGVLPSFKKGESNIIPDKQTNTPQDNNTFSTEFLFRQKKRVSKRPSGEIVTKEELN